MSDANLTSTSSSQEEALTRELLLEQAIDEQLDTIVKLAETLIRESGIVGKLEKSQLRNAATVASSTGTSFEMVKNWVRYQVGRAQGWPAEFAQKVIDHGDQNLRKLAEQIVVEVNRGLASTGAAALEAKEVHRVHNQLLRLYLGYANRYFTYESFQAQANKRNGG